MEEQATMPFGQIDKLSREAKPSSPPPPPLPSSSTTRKGNCYTSSLTGCQLIKKIFIWKFIYRQCRRLFSELFLDFLKDQQQLFILVREIQSVGQEVFAVAGKNKTARRLGVVWE